MHGKVEFELKDYGHDVLLTRREQIVPPIKGLPPYGSMSIALQHNEIDELIKVLTDYAKQRRN